MPVKNFENWSIIGEDIDKKKMPRFYGPQCIKQSNTTLQHSAHMVQKPI